MRDPRERLRDVLEAIERIERYAARGRDAFEGDELLQSWFVRHLQIIGEAVRTLPADVRDRAPDVPWSKIVGMRCDTSWYTTILRSMPTPSGRPWNATSRS